MKKLLLILLVIATSISHLCAQKKTFLRVYDLPGKKFAKGFFAGTTDSCVRIMKSDTDTISIRFSSIGKIKTRRSPGHTALICAVACGITAGAVAAVANDPNASFLRFSTTEAFAGGFMIGAGAGLLIGGIAGVTKKSQEFKIDGNWQNWQQLKPEINKLPANNTDTNQ